MIALNFQTVDVPPRHAATWVYEKLGVLDRDIRTIPDEVFREWYE